MSEEKQQPGASSVMDTFIKILTAHIHTHKRTHRNTNLLLVSPLTLS